MGNDFTRRNFMVGMGSLLTLPMLAKTENANAEGLFVASVPDATSNPSPGLPGYTSVQALPVPTLQGNLNGNVREFKLTAEPVVVMWPDMSDGMGMTNRAITTWGYNGSQSGPTLEAVEGETFRCIFTNHLPEPTTVHFHGLHLPIQMDGVPDFSQEAVPPGGTFVYEFPLLNSGTYMYHSHYMTAKQVGMGQMGFFIVHPKNPPASYKVDHDYAFLLHTWMIKPGESYPDPLEMTEFNYFTMNGRPGPAGAPNTYMKAKVGEKVRIRVANLSMLHHTAHLHGHTYRVTEYGAGFVPESMQIPANTIGIGAAEVRTLEFEARAPGKWMFHCHFTHHTMNDMHRNPQLSDPPMMQSMMGMMDMGGMATWIEVKA